MKYLALVATISLLSNCSHMNVNPLNTRVPAQASAIVSASGSCGIVKFVEADDRPSVGGQIEIHLVAGNSEQRSYVFDISDKVRDKSMMRASAVNMAFLSKITNSRICLTFEGTSANKLLKVSSGY